MNRKQVWMAAVGLVAALGAGAAMARGNDEVRWSVTIGSPVGTPIYAPAPVVRVPVHTVPAPVYGARGHGERRHDARPTRWDRDGDGIPNRRDRVYNPRWDRDGDGIPNRHDRYDRHRGNGYGWR